MADELSFTVVDEASFDDIPAPAAAGPRGGRLRDAGLAYRCDRRPGRGRLVTVRPACRVSPRSLHPRALPRTARLAGAVGGDLPADRLGDAGARDGGRGTAQRRVR